MFVEKRTEYLIVLIALPSLIHRSFRLLSSLPRLRFSSHRSEFAAITFGKDKVLPHANGPIVLSSTVVEMQSFFTLKANKCHAKEIRCLLIQKKIQVVLTSMDHDNTE